MTGPEPMPGPIDLKVTFQFDDLTPKELTELSLLLRPVTEFQERRKASKEATA